MMKLMKDVDRYNRYDCAVTGKKIMPGMAFYSVMAPRKSGAGLMRTRTISIKAGDVLVAQGKAEIVNR